MFWQCRKRNKTNSKLERDDDYIIECYDASISYVNYTVEHLRTFYVNQENSFGVQIISFTASDLDWDAYKRRRSNDPVLQHYFVYRDSRRSHITVDLSMFSFQLQLLNF